MEKVITVTYDDDVSGQGYYIDIGSTNPDIFDSVNIGFKEDFIEAINEANKETLIRNVHLELLDDYVRQLWNYFGDLLMNPETEEMEENFLHFSIKTHREEIWHWFDKRFSTGVAGLMHLV